MSFRHYLTTNFIRRPELRQVDRNVALNEEQLQGGRAEDVADMTSLLRHVPRETNEAKKNISQDGVNLSEFAAGKTEAHLYTSAATQSAQLLYAVRISCKKSRPVCI
jgi:hypothetical protein